MASADISRELLKQAWQREVGAKIKEARTARKMTQAQLASAAGIDQPHMARIEAGTMNVSIGTLGLICSAMAMSINIESPKFGEK